jgi:hypothetical protein
MRSEGHHERLLTLAGEAYDRAAEARETLERDGAFFNDRFGTPRPTPPSRSSATPGSPSRGWCANCA